jgi:hypothetical protein
LERAEAVVAFPSASTRCGPLQESNRCAIAQAGENESSDVVFTEISSNQARIRPVNRTGPDGNCFYPR